ncbi:MAG: hypothetical protein IJ484_08805 [Oscillospiraceae bacterium]|nr:hypothetical protein [Oscillospiraceae bacterium]
MGQGILMLVEIGFFAAFFDFANPYLSVPMYGLVLIGFLIHRLLLKRCRTRPGRWAFAGVLMAAAVCGELACAVITGWDLLGVLILYGFVWCLAIGAFAAAVWNTAKKYFRP